jgi:hypothetical protein
VPEERVAVVEVLRADVKGARRRVERRDIERMECIM